jgi:ABC-2 type transport system ATP-binding protein
MVEPLTVRQRVGYVPEAHHFDRWMRVAQVVGFCRSLYESWNDRTCQEMLDLFQLDSRKKVKHLSKGMLVKLSLVLAVSHEPEVLVLDEPMAGLDPLAREEFLDGVLRTICDGGQTVLFSTHSLDDVQRLADTVGILYDGRLLVHRNIDELLATTKRIRATLPDGRPPERLPANTIWQRVQGREWQVTVRDFTPETVEQMRSQQGVEHVEVVDLGLEDLFKDFIRGRRAVP